MEWRAKALCQAFDSGLFMADSPDVARAKQICFWCPVRTQCLNAGLAYGEDGIWGGTTKAERQIFIPKTAIGSIQISWEPA